MSVCMCVCLCVCRSVKGMWLQFPLPACRDVMSEWASERVCVCVCAGFIPCVTRPVPWCVPELSLTLHWFVWKYCLFTQQVQRPLFLCHQCPAVGRSLCSFIWLCVCMCVIGVIEWGLQYVAERLRVQDCVNGMCVGVCVSYRFDVSVCELTSVSWWYCWSILLIHRLHVYTHTHTHTHTHNQTHTAPACPDRIHGVRYSDQKHHLTSSYQHHPSFCLPPVLPLALLFLPSQDESILPFSLLPSSPFFHPPSPSPPLLPFLSPCPPHFLSYPIHLSLPLAASPRSPSFPLSVAFLPSSPQRSAKVATLFCSRARH